MKCPKCDGYGIVGDAVPDILRGRGHIFSSNECDRCHGSGEVEMTKLCNTCEYLKFCARSGIEDVGCDRYQKDTTTNEEWLRSATTEQLAKWLQEHTDCSNCDCNKDLCYKGYDCCELAFLEWLKQPHHSKE